VREKLRIFPYWQYVVKIYISLAFQRYSQVWGRCWFTRNLQKCNSLHTQNGHSAARYAPLTSCDTSIMLRYALYGLQLAHAVGAFSDVGVATCSSQMTLGRTCFYMCVVSNYVHVCMTNALKPTIL